METGIEVVALEAFASGEKMIGTYLARPAIHREVVPTLAAAVALKEALLGKHASISVFGHVRHTRSPRGYKGNEYLVRGDNVTL